MHKNLFLSAIFILGLSVFSAFAQTTTVKPSAISGEVGSIDGEKIVLKTANGDIEAVLSDKTQYFRVPPENPTLKAAVASTVSEIGVGDKLLVTGILSDDKKSIPAKAVYLMSKSAIAERQTNFLEDWKKRGTYGKVVRYDPQTKVITISTRSFGVEKTIAVKPKDNAEFYRYQPNSIEIELNNSTRSKLTDIDINDEIRVLGNKNAEGTEIEAEKIVSGSFKQSGGTIKAINFEKNEIIISDFQTKKDISIVVSDHSILKQFPAEMAQRMAMMQAGGGGGQGGFRPPTQGGGQTTPQPATQQNTKTPGQTPGGAGQGGGFRAGGGIDDSRFQNIKLTDLKVGEMIGVLSSKNPDPTRITAIKLFSGVEPFIKMSQAAGGGNGGGRQGGGASLNIPGLDGFGGN
jgi:hypothetical protein